MELYQSIYFKIIGPLAIISTFMVYRYIYGFSIQRIKKWILVAAGICFFVSFFLESGETGELVLGACILGLCELLLFLSVPRKRIRHMLWLWPIVSTGALSYQLTSLVRVAVFGKTNSPFWDIIEEASNDIFTIVILIILWQLDKKNHFTQRIKSTERFILGITSTFLMVVMIELTEGGISANAGKYSSLIIWGSIVAFILISCIMVRMLMQGNSAQFYMEMSRLNEKYIEEEVKHFEAYKKMQEETKKLRHDMKNHLTCIKILLEEGNRDQLMKYVEDLSLEISNLTVEMETNNSVVDAIISSKRQISKEQGIDILINGDLSVVKNVKAIDWCKIFANAIDNGIEALGKLDESYDKTLYIRIKKNLNFCLIWFENECEQLVELKNGKVESYKEDKENHGFGIENIKSAVENYHGDINISCKKNQNRWKFVLEILLPLDFDQ